MNNEHKYAALTAQEEWTVSERNPAGNGISLAGLSELQVRKVFSVISQILFTDLRNDFVKRFQ